jgi:pimeloyl-ACP methyl ester carboxylesterase
LGFLEHLAPSFLSEGVGVIGLERRGVKVDGIDSKEYHLFNTPSQRLVDHIELVRYLQNHPPRGWNGQLFALGGSEGGPIAIKLASSMDLDLCVVLCGCGSQPFRDLIWAFIQRISPKFKPFLPSSREEYDQLCEWIKTHPDPEKFWLGQTYLYWSDALDQSEDREFLSLNCPAIVVAGSEDSECASTDRLIERAHQLQRNVKYLRIEGMGHEALEPRWQVLKKIIECLKECSI